MHRTGEQAARFACVRPAEFLTIVATILSLGSGCRGPEMTPAPFSDAPGNVLYVSHVSSGAISRMGPVTVRLTGTFAQRETDAAALAAAFSFTPRIEGSAQWVNERTLVFTPRSPLSPGSRHVGVVDMGKILPAAEDAGPLRLEFTVAPNRVVGLRGAFELVNDGDPRQVILVG
ncbi:MAG: hypothetical protein MUE60_13500, partial [Candidatus Eisenbacteria bacterium]|nr:hypothetical protein [Candidatus Eisenbacteria bacterium]